MRARSVSGTGSTPATSRVVRTPPILLAVTLLALACAATLALACVALLAVPCAAWADASPAAAPVPAAPAAATSDAPAPTDTTPPTSTSDAPSGWQNAPFTVTFTAHDDASVVATVWSWLDDNAPQSGLRLAVPAPADGSFDGIHTLTWYAVDNAGNPEAPQTAVLRIDTTGPTTIGKTVTAFTGHAVQLDYEALDALSPQVGAVALVLTDSRGKVVQRVALGTKNANTWYSTPWTPSATGTYRYTVSAQDLAGNAQRGATPAKVVVKGPWWYTIGHSVQHRAIVVARFGTGARRLLVVGGVHGNEYGTAVAQRFAAYLAAHPGAVPAGARIDVIRCANPDGYAHGTRGNARHVDLNRNLPTANWTHLLSAGDEPGNPGLTGGRSPGSEPETKALLAYLRTGFAAVVSLHSRAGILDCDGPGARALGRRMSKLCGLPVGRLSYDPSITGSLGEFVPARYHVPVVTVELRSTALSAGLRAALLAAAKS